MYYSAEKKDVKGCRHHCSVCNIDDEYAIERPEFGGLPRCSACQRDGRFIQHRLKKFTKKC